MSIEIKNMRNEKPTHKYDIRVDRKSCLGNPFIMSDESKRDEVCDKYEAWFKANCAVSLASENFPWNFRQELIRLKRIFKEYGKLRLFCWCAPKRCHAETIRDYLLKG